MSDLKLRFHGVDQALTPIGTLRGDTRFGVLVQLTEGRGISAWGEATPLPLPASVASAGGTMTALRAWDGLWSAEFGSGRAPTIPTAPGQVAEWAAGVLHGVSLPREWWCALCFGLETACLHLMMLIQQRERGDLGGVQASALAASLGGRDVGSGADLRLSSLSSGTGIDALRLSAHNASRAGRTALKVKVGHLQDEAWQQLLGDLRILQTELALPVRLDANGAWTPEVAKRRMAELVGSQVEFVEQPVAAGALAALGPTEVAWFADESMGDPREVSALLREGGGCRGIVIKPALIGGLFRARDLAVRAQRLGMDVVVTHAFDGPIARHAARALALSLERAPLACGLGDEPILDRFLPPGFVPIEDLYVG